MKREWMDARQSWEIVKNHIEVDREEHLNVCIRVNVIKGEMESAHTVQIIKKSEREFRRLKRIRKVVGKRSNSVGWVLREGQLEGW